MVEDKDAVEPKEIADEASTGMIQCGKCSITNTMNEWIYTQAMVLEHRAYIEHAIP
jgi:hypothetical protein